MKNYLFVLIITTFALLITPLHQKTGSRGLRLYLPSYLQNYHAEMKNTFQRADNANLIFAFVTGMKEKVSYKTKKKFQDAYVGFVLNPSGLHWAIFFLFFNPLFSRIKQKKMKFLIKQFFTIAPFFFLPFLSLKRLSLLKFLMSNKYYFHIKCSNKWLYLITAFLTIDHYFINPLSYIYSFAILGTLFSMKNESKGKLLMSLFATQTLLNLFILGHISLFGFLLSFLLVFLFEILFFFIIIYYFLFYFTSLNWIEFFIQKYVEFLQFSTKISVITKWNADLNLFLILLLFVFLKPSKMRIFLLVILFMTLSPLALTPIILRQ